MTLRRSNSCSHRLAPSGGHLAHVLDLRDGVRPSRIIGGDGGQGLLEGAGAFMFSLQGGGWLRPVTLIRGRSLQGRRAWLPHLLRRQDDLTPSIA
jgi:hypothetical protein